MIIKLTSDKAFNKATYCLRAHGIDFRHINGNNVLQIEENARQLLISRLEWEDEE